jgi:metallophosphoesterase superfamily enzyme
VSVKTWVVMNDLQIPFHDRVAVGNVLNFVDDLKPYGVILNGDIVDCYSISDFSKNPLSEESLLQEIQIAGKVMDRLAKRTIKRVWIGGNHEDRWRRYIWKNAPELSKIDGMSFASAFKLKDYGFAWLEYGDMYTLGKLHFTHGSYITNAAKRTLAKYGESVMMGHTHKLVAHYNRTLKGIHAGYENGCLCLLTPEYDAFPDWHQGVAVVHVDDQTGFYNVQQIPILDGGVFYYGNTKIGGRHK